MASSVKIPSMGGVTIALSVLCSIGLVDASVQWSGELRNLDFAALTQHETQQLSTEYAKDVAAALGMNPADVVDIHGHPGRVSLGSPTDTSMTFGSTSSTWEPRETTQSVTTTTTTIVTSTSTSTSPMPPLSPLRGIAYGAVPCTTRDCSKRVRPSEDMLLEAYAGQWGAQGRDDLGIMSRMGANAVLLYHSLGLDKQHDHGKFLDRAQEVGLNVMPGFDKEAVRRSCDKFDCFDAWKQATLQAFKIGFRQGDSWHPAISALVLLNEPDFFGGYAECDDGGAWCRVKAVLSALDGVLAAEQEAGLEPGRVKLTVTWSFGSMLSIDGKEDGPGIFGFQDTVAGVQNPQLAKYTPRSSQAVLEHAFRTRWVHGVNTQAPWTFVKKMISDRYAKFAPIPWFLGEYGASNQSAATIQSDLEDMQRTAEADPNFLGAAFFQFQTAYFKGGSELNFGLFSLGSRTIGEVTPPCKRSHCPAWPVHCLSTKLTWLSGTRANRAEAVAAAWKGSLDGAGFCEATTTSTTTETPLVETRTTSVLNTSEVSTEVHTTTALATTSAAASGSPSAVALRGVAYGALPCTKQACSETGWVSEDMMQEAYAEQWGADGRDDLGTIARLGANAVRMYHSLGLNVQQDHGGFLNRARAVGLNVMPGYHTELVHKGCPRFDCYKSWKDATLQGFKFGFKQGDQWHPAISALILLNEPDFFGHDPMCQPSGAWCRVKAMLSALDGVLAAEREAGVKAGHVKLTVTWSFGQMSSIDGKVTAPGLFGFQDTVAGIANPSIAHYTPRSKQSELEHAFKTRWVHGMNTQAPWSFVKNVIGSQYAQFAPIQWFIGEYGANGQSAAVVQSDLEDIQRTAEAGDDFLGAAFFQFQTAHFKGGAETNFGMFRLGSEKLGEIKPPCYEEPSYRCPSPWPVYCLSANLSWLPNTIGDRAQAVAAAWQGSLQGSHGFCKEAQDGARRLSGIETMAAKSTRVACTIRTSQDVDIGEVKRKLQEQDFVRKLVQSSTEVLGSSDAIVGDVSLDNAFAITAAESNHAGEAGGAAKSLFQGWLPAVLVIAVLAIASGALCGFVAHRKKKAGQVDSNVSGSSAV